MNQETRHEILLLALAAAIVEAPLIAAPKIQHRVPVGRHQPAHAYRQSPIGRKREKAGPGVARRKAISGQ